MTRRGVRRLLILVAATAAFAIVIGAAFIVRQRSQAERLERARAEGMRLYEAQQPVEAFEHLNTYVSRVKDDPEALLAFAHCRLAVELPNSRHVAAAVAAAKLASDVAPDDPEPLEFQLAIFVRIGRQTETLDVCESLLELDPTDRTALAARVAALSTLGRTDDARRAADAFVATYPDDLGAYAARVEVLRAAGASAEEVENDLRSEDVAARLSGVPLYHIRVALASADAAVSATDPAARSAAFARAAESARQAIVTGPREPVEALEATGLLRRLGIESGDAALVAESEAAVEAFIASGSLGDSYAAQESRRAWWRLDDRRAGALADLIPEETSDPEALGWLSYRAGRDSAYAARLAEQDTDESRYWLSTLGAISLATGGGTPVAVDQALEDASGAAARLDQRRGLRDRSDLIALVRAESLLRAGQVESAREVLANAAARRPARERARLVASLAGVYTRLAETERAGALLALLGEQGVDPNLARTVVSRYLETRLRLTDTGQAEAEARAQLERVASAAAASPDDPSLAAMHARMLLVTGQTDAGLEEAARLTGLSSPPPSASLAELARLVWSEDVDLASRLLDLGGPLQDAPLGLVITRASLEAIADSPEAGLGVIEGMRESHDGPRFALERARFIERYGLPGALDAFRDASDRFAADALVQQGVLESRAAWDEQALVRRAIARLRNATGEDALEWRIASLQADLRYLDDLDEGARASELSRITLELRQLSKRAPENTRLLRYIAIAYDRAGSASEALVALRRASDLDPAYTPELVRVLLREGRTAEANEALDSLSALDAQRLPTPTLRERASLLETMGRADEAVDDRRLLARSGASGDIAAYGTALAAAGRNEDARAQALDLLSRSRSAEAAGSAARILVRTGDTADAVARYLEARSATDGEPDARTALARILVALGAWDDAIEQATIARGLGEDPSGDRSVLLIHALLESGRAGEAASLAEAAQAGSRLAAALRAALVDGADGAGLARVLAATALSFEDGSDELTEALVSFLLGETDRGTYETSVRELTEGASSALAWGALAETARPDGAEAYVAVLEEAASALPQAVWPLISEAQVYLGGGDLDAADRVANRLAERQGRALFEADLLRGRIAAARGDWEATLTWLLPHRERIARGEADELDAAILTRGLARTGRFDEAERIIEARSAAGAPGAGVYLDAAMELVPEDTERMRRWLERASNAAPRPLASAWAELARRSEAIPDAERAQELFSRLDEASLGVLASQDLASVEVLLGQRDQAEARLARLVETTPDDPLLLNNFAYLLVTEFGKPDRAGELANRALRMAREAGYPPMAVGVVGHTLATAQRALGETASAESTLRDAIRDAGPFPDAIIELAEILIEKGARQEAGELLTRLPRRDVLSNEQRRRVESAARALE